MINTASLRWSSFSLVSRVVFLVLLAATELIALRFWLDATGIMSRRAGLPHLLYGWGIWLSRSAVVFAVLILVLTYVRAKDAVERLSTEVSLTPIAWRPLTGHLVAMLAVAALSVFLYGSGSTGSSFAIVVSLWLATGMLAMLLAAVAVLPPRVWMLLLRAGGNVWVYALVGALATCLLGPASLSLWNPLVRLTFDTVSALLHPFLSKVIANPEQMIVGSPKFQVTIFPACSGLEGMALMVVFGAVWLWFFRSECRFPQALLLIPAGVAILWCLNAVRIATLILIGDGGAPAVAVGGFHAEAGWIAFTAVALGFFASSRRLNWVTVAAPASVHDEAGAGKNPTATYLMPFLTILAAGMISGAASAGPFEWLYPLRFVAAAATLWLYRREYAQIDWRFGWAGPLTGSIVFVIWLALDRLTSHPADSGLGLALAGLPVPARIAWLSVRTLATVTTIPLAEELAFRGFLMRRLISADFELVSYRRCGYLAVLISSVVFGLLHGDRWMAGIVAGVVYAAVLLRRGRLGDAFAAHATTNALLAAVVVVQGRWGLW